MKRPKDYVPGWEPDHVIMQRLIPHYKIPIAKEVPCAREVPPSPTRIYVGNIHPVVTEDELKDFFHKFSDIKAFKLCKRNEDDEMSLGYAFCEFEFPSDAVVAFFGLRGVQVGGPFLPLCGVRETPSLL